jgi:hypothetical protein
MTGTNQRSFTDRTVVTEYAELNWTTSMIPSESMLRIPRYQRVAVEALN